MGGRLVATFYRLRGEARSERIGVLRARINRIKSDSNRWLLSTRFVLGPWVKAQWNGRLLKHAGRPASTVPPRGLVVVAPFYGDDRLLSGFLEHHRNLGADVFVFLDLAPTAGLAARLADQSDCAVWRPRSGPDPEKAIYWLNFLRRRYASGRWCLSLEPNELFVFPRCETRQIKDLMDFLDTERRGHLYALVIEMYGDRPAAELALDPGRHPLSALPYFDPYGYTTSPRVGPLRSVAMRGGVQRRTLFREQPRRAPALNRVPLVKWRRFYGYVAGTRLLMPRELNHPHAASHSTPTAALLRFALLESESALSLAAQVERCAIAPDSGGSLYARIAELCHRVLRHDSSERFRTSEDLIECGLLNNGQWF